MLTPDSASRLTLAAVKQHPWVLLPLDEYATRKALAEKVNNAQSKQAKENSSHQLASMNPEVDPAEPAPKQRVAAPKKKLDFIGSHCSLGKTASATVMGAEVHDAGTAFYDNEFLLQASQNEVVRQILLINREVFEYRFKPNREGNLIVLSSSDLTVSCAFHDPAAPKLNFQKAEEDGDQAFTDFLRAMKKHLHPLAVLN